MEEGDDLFGIHQAALIPVYHWRGARPPLLDLEADQRGSLLCLLFARDGDCRLLPIAWRYEQAPAEEPDPLQPTLPFEENSLDRESLALARRSLEQDGWCVEGRLELYFAGRHAERAFWRRINAYLHTEDK